VVDSPLERLVGEGTYIRPDNAPVGEHPLEEEESEEMIVGVSHRDAIFLDMDHQHVRVCRADIVLDDQLSADPGCSGAEAGMLEFEACVG
jgi:hypothetical protein